MDKKCQNCFKGAEGISSIGAVRIRYKYCHIIVSYKPFTLDSDIVQCLVLHAEVIKYDFKVLLLLKH